MFKFVDNKEFFRFCNIVSIATLIFILVEEKENFVTVAISALSIIVLLQVGLFYKNNRKTILKIMISVLLTFLLIEEIFAINGLIFKYGSTLVMPYYWCVHIVNFIILFFLFNNHFFVDYMNINKTKVLHFNVITSLLYMIIAIVDIIGLFVIASPDKSIIKPGFANVLASSIYRISTVFVIICCEVKINGLVNVKPEKTKNKKKLKKSKR